MIDCPNCMTPFRGLECECGYKVPPPDHRPALPFAEFIHNDTEEEKARRRERVAELKRQFFRKGMA